MSGFSAFHNIGKFENVVYEVNRYCERHQIARPTMDFRGTAKLHGTNAGIRREVDGGVVRYIAQARNRDATIDCDNYGIAAFLVSTPPEIVESLFRQAIPGLDTQEEPTYLFGEWCGGNIQSGVALSKLPRTLVLFSAKYGDSTYPIEPGISAPEHDIRNIRDIEPFFISIDFSRPEESRDKLKELTLQVEAECPWGRHLGVEKGEDGLGCIGEGIVWVCVDRPNDTRLWFKTKGDKHQKKDKTGKSKTNVRATPEKSASARAWVDEHLQEWRFEQGLDFLRQQGLGIEAKNTGEFIRFICSDLAREEALSLVASDLTWKDVSGSVASAARQYFLSRAL